MPRDRARGRRSTGKSKSNKDDSPLYTGRGSWPIVEWHTKHELSKLGLPGSIVHHKTTSTCPRRRASPARSYCPPAFGPRGLNTPTQLRSLALTLI